MEFCSAETYMRRINSSVATLVLKGDASIKFVKIIPNQSNLLPNDGVHLSTSVNNEFL